MPNEVYQHTLEGLSQLVSARAASQVLDASLGARGYAATEVNYKQMRNLLLGPVLREFSVILPRRGLKQNLRELAESLKALEPAKPTASFKIEDTIVDPIDPEAAELSELPTEISADTSVEESLDEKGTEDFIDDLVGAPTLFEKPDKGPKVSVTGRLKGSTPTLFQESEQAKGVALADAPDAATQATLSQETLEHLSLNFAKLDHVTLVAALKPNGEIATSRGGGIDLESLSRLGLLGLKLLGKSGKLRSYYLAYGKGQLFLFHLDEATLLVVGTPELNLGAVFSTMSTLKEAL